MGLDGGFLDPYEWSADIAELICTRSAVIRLGARIVADDHELPVPVLDPVVNPGGRPHAPDYIGHGQAIQRLNVTPRTLRPRDHRLAASLVVPNELVRDAVEHPEIALALKEDLAGALAHRADRGFLHGRGPVEPVGIMNNRQVAQAPGVRGDLLATARAMVARVRGYQPLLPVFRNPGWVIHPATVERLASTLTREGLRRADPFLPPGVARRSLETLGLLTLDGSDSGTLLGFPFVTSTAAFEGVSTLLYFSADWEEAWIGVDRDLVEVEVSAEAAFQTDETVLRAVMHHDFVLRRPAAFTFAVL